jgi:hypothetical protein
MVWTALSLAVVVRNNVRFRLWCSQIILACNARQALKLNPATRSVALWIVSYLTMIAQLSNANRQNSAPRDAILVSAPEAELLSHLHHVVVRPALL